jgi:hypothetical protein
MSYIYLASPYSDIHRAVRYLRFTLAELCCANLFRSGITVYSPIVHNHSMARRHSLPDDAEWWRTHNETMLEQAHKLWILDIDGWRHSEGIAAEIAFWTARSNDRPGGPGIMLVSIEGEPYDYVAPPAW